MNSFKSIRQQRFQDVVVILGCHFGLFDPRNIMVDASCREMFAKKTPLINCCLKSQVYSLQGFCLVKLLCAIQIFCLVN